MDLYALRCGGFAELQLGAEVRAEVEAGPFVVVGRQWRREDVVGGTGGYAGERWRRRTRARAGR
jgi:hypothetical protein